jgi:hypothetical protein
MARQIWSTCHRLDELAVAHLCGFPAGLRDNGPGFGSGPFSVMADMRTPIPAGARTARTSPT